MAISPSTTLRHAVTAFLLLIVSLVGLELWLRSQMVAAARVVAGHVPAGDQSLLVPSSVSHHELRRMSQIIHQATPASSPVSFRVNSAGCRGAEVTVPVPEGVYRILLLGDDSVCGTSVTEEESIAGRLGKFLAKVSTRKLEIINGGVPGYCPLLSRLRYESDLQRLKPELVILHVDMTDISDDICYRSLMLQEGSNAICTHATLRLQPKPQNALFQYVSQSATASLVLEKARQHGPGVLSTNHLSAFSDSGIGWITDSPPDLRIQIRHALQPIRELQDSVIKSGGQLLVTTSPLLWQVVSGDEAPEMTRRLGIRGATPFKSRFPFEVLASFCEESRIHFCDTSSAFQMENAGRLFSKEAPILSRIGMTLYAREIARCLIADPPSKWSR